MKLMMTMVAVVLTTIMTILMLVLELLHLSALVAMAMWEHRMVVQMAMTMRMVEPCCCCGKPSLCRH